MSLGRAHRVADADPASPCTFENVRRTITLRFSANVLEGMRVFDTALLREILCVIEVSLVENDDHVLRLTLARKRSTETASRNDPVGLFGICEEDDPSVRVDRLENRIQIESAIEQRNFNQPRAGCLRDSRIRDEVNKRW